MPAEIKIPQKPKINLDDEGAQVLALLALEFGAPPGVVVQMFFEQRPDLKGDYPYISNFLFTQKVKHLHGELLKWLK